MDESKLQRVQKIAERKISESSPGEEHPGAFALSDVFETYAPNISTLWYEAGQNAADMNAFSVRVASYIQKEDWEKAALDMFAAFENAYRESTHWFEGLSQKKELDKHTLAKESRYRWNVSQTVITYSYPEMVRVCDRLTGFCERNTMRLPAGDTTPVQDAHWKMMKEQTDGLARRFQILRDAANQHAAKFSDVMLRFNEAIQDDLQQIGKELQEYHYPRYYNITPK